MNFRVELRPIGFIYCLFKNVGKICDSTIVNAIFIDSGNLFIIYFYLFLLYIYYIFLCIKVLCFICVKNPFPALVEDKGNPIPEAWKFEGVLAVSSSFFFWVEDVALGVYWNFSSLGVAVPITTGITLASIYSYIKSFDLLIIKPVFL